MEIIHEPLLRQQKEMVKDNLDALIAMSPDNVGYTAGYMVPSQVLDIRDRTFVCIVTADCNAKMIVASAEYTYAQENSKIKDVRPYEPFTESPMQILAEELNAYGLARSRIGIELDFIPAELFLDLRRHLPNANLVPAKNTFDRCRMIKTKVEIDYLRRAAKIADSARQIACRKAYAGMTERDLGRLILDNALEQGADGLLALQVGSGYRSAFGNPPPTDKRLEHGELIKIDIFLGCNGYLSDNGKAAVVSEASEFQTRTWAILNDTQSAILERVRPGVSTKELWEVFVDRFNRANLKPAMLFLGHGLGLGLHEEPYISATSDTILESNMVFCIEPIYKISGQMGFHIEDEILVTEKGHEVFTDNQASRELAVIRSK